MQTFIGFTGVKGSGKSTSFEYVKEAYPGVVEVMLAGKLKDACAEVLKVPRKSFDDPAVKEKDLAVPVHLNPRNVEALIKLFEPAYKSVGVTFDWDKHVRPHIGMILESPRRIAQYVGTEVLRNLHEDIHCLGATVGLPEDTVYVVTDIRFPSELDFFAARYPANFYFLYIANYAAESHVGPNSHASEKFVLELAKKATIKIDNNGTKEELRERVLSNVQDILDREGFQRRTHA